MDLRGQSLDPVELFAKYHIVGLRHSKTGYVRQVKHVTFGWMTPQAYYGLQKAHDVLDRIDPLKLAALAVLIHANKKILDLGGSTILAKFTSQAGVDWTAALQLIVGGPASFLLSPATWAEFLASVIPGYKGKLPPDQSEGLKWAEAILAAILELELGPVLLSGLKLL